MNNSTKILVIGACGQLGTELTKALLERHGKENVFTADIHEAPTNGRQLPGYVQLDVLNAVQLEKFIVKNKITQVYLLAAMLSAAGEKNQNAAWKLNMQSLLSILEIAKDHHLDKVFWPSSIAVFGPGSPKYNCPQNTRMEPNTVYGISKRAGEQWCAYYFEKYGVDVRSVRFPGLISFEAPPGGGTTDYAVEIFHQALEKQQYTCFLTEDNCLPMMYMNDAVRAALELMDAPKENIIIRTSYNIAGLSIAPCDLAEAIRRHVPAFKISYEPDYRNAIANGWPASIKDEQARNDWGWRPAYNLKRMTEEMLSGLLKAKCTTVNHPASIQLNYPDFQLEE